MSQHGPTRCQINSSSLVDNIALESHFVNQNVFLFETPIAPDLFDTPGIKIVHIYVNSNLPKKQFDKRYDFDAFLFYTGLISISL